MMARIFVLSAMLASLSAAPAFAQSADELLQKGITLQETDGDIDGAIQIYGQVIALSGDARPLAAQAQMRISGALLQKGDLAGAAREFGKLARDYADQEDLVTALGQRLRTLAQNGPTLLLGDSRGGRYHHYWTGVELTLPSGWYFKTQKPDEGLWDRVDLGDSNSRTTSAFLVMQREITPPERIAGVLMERYRYKVAVQRRDADGYLGYRVRAGSFKHRLIGGQQAWSAVADYRNADGEAMSEYLVRVQSGKCALFFSVSAPAADFASVEVRFEPVLLTAVVP